MSDEETEFQEQESEEVGNQTSKEQGWATKNLEHLAEARKQQTKSESPVDSLKSAEKQIQKIQKILRVINGASAATLVGLIITFIIMNLQLILGNGLKLKYVPPLGRVEILLLAIVDVSIIIQLVFETAVFGALFYAGACLSGYWDTAKCAWGAL
ncbi:MAG: hypothetical protein AAB793_01990 [Patescibacteria group bacterium]